MIKFSLTSLSPSPGIQIERDGFGNSLCPRTSSLPNEIRSAPFPKNLIGPLQKYHSYAHSQSVSGKDTTFQILPHIRKIEKDSCNAWSFDTVRPL